MARLRRSDCGEKGYLRRRRGRGFSYTDAAGKPLGDREEIARIEALSIPPAWRDVWICSDPLGHLQATGIDAAGRKQYLYHERWRAHRDRQKFDAMLAFGRSLPRLRRRVARDLRASELSQERVTACAVRLLDLGFFRIGSEDYAERNESYGLATMLRRHVSVADGELIFDYPAKSGQRRVQAIADADALDVVTALKRRRGGGEVLLAYRGKSRWVNVRADDINAYLKEAAAGDFSAKDFRTWNATVLAAVALADRGDARSRSARERAIRETVEIVAAYLGNTPAVCRASYIDPRVFDHYRANVTIAPTTATFADPSDISQPRLRRRVERAVLDLLGDEPAR